MHYYPYSVTHPHHYRCHQIQSSIYPLYHHSVRAPYPEVDSTYFTHSAAALKKLLENALLFSTRLSENKTFAKNIMEAAQQGNTKKVIQLIQTTGSQELIKVTYNPDGLHIRMTAQAQNVDCCHLDLTIRWR